MPTAKKVECGQRLERGVLARASYYSDSDDHNHAQYGEFPWHVSTRPSTTITPLVTRGILVYSDILSIVSQSVLTWSNFPC